MPFDLLIVFIKQAVNLKCLCRFQIQERANYRQ